MKNIIQLLFIPVIVLLFSQSASRVYAMEQLNKEFNPLKRSKIENGVSKQPNTEYMAALDAAKDETDTDGTTALHVAASKGNIRMCKELLSRGANRCVQNQAGNSSLHCAVLANQFNVVQLLIDGMPKSAKRARIITALCILKRNNFPKVLLPTVFAYLPELVTAYPALCKKLVPMYILQEQLLNAQHQPRLNFLNLKNANGDRATDIARNNRKSFLARMTNPNSSRAACQDELKKLLAENKIFENSEN